MKPQTWEEAMDDICDDLHACRGALILLKRAIENKANEGTMLGALRVAEKVLKSTEGVCNGR